ncbi:DUF29 family protein [Pseudoduganella sp. FT55W]|uniref:DUF29 family protein n=1 Tax=Duganella rivi TaxID=2666083 RepID=A0A7X4GMV4_9BURK|nr:DUF29 family protein [Duganella rivi]MYM66417.1 DUF29 family protein [Duganella rivi]
MSTQFYDPLQWTKELAFWPDEIASAGLPLRQLLVQRCGELLAHLARWQRQEGNQCLLWRRLIVLQRMRIARMLSAAPELRAMLGDEECIQDAWLSALLKVIGEANCFDLPDASPWSLEQALDQDFFPQ